MDTFFVSVERVLNSSLIGKPVMVGEGVVAACSYEARKFGVHSGMPTVKAKQLCPQGIYLKGSGRVYAEKSDEIYSIMQSYTPDIHRASIDEAYLNMTGFDRLYGNPMKPASALSREIKKKTGLDCSIGIASSRVMAKISSKYAKPSGILRVLPGYEKIFLSDLPVSAIPGVGKEFGKQLAMFGIRTVGDMHHVSEEAMEQAFGKNGRSLLRKALGLDSSGVVSEEVKSIGNERTFSDTIDKAVLRRKLVYLSEKVGNRLRMKSFRAFTITLKLRYSDFQTMTRAHTFIEATNLDNEIFEAATDLFHKCHKRRISIRLLGVNASHLVKDYGQISLFPDPAREKHERLCCQVDKVKEKYGFDSLMYAARSIKDRRKDYDVIFPS